MSVHFNRNIVGLLVSLALLTTLFVSSVSSDCGVWVYSSMTLPVENVEVTWMDEATNVTLNSTLTDGSGYAILLGNCTNVSARIKYPSSAYSAVLQNASVVSDVHINNIVTGRVQLVNTLGQYLEGQDCSVTVYLANTSTLVHDYETQCKQDQPYIDSTGNWVATTDCKFTDSLGWYYFQGRTDESLGFEYNRYYDLVYVCNGKTETVTFQLDLEKAPLDDEKIIQWITQYGGWIMAFVMLLGIAVVVLATIFWFLSHKSSLS